jgi:hypothetical protein
MHTQFHRLSCLAVLLTLLCASCRNGGGVAGGPALKPLAAGQDLRCEEGRFTLKVPETWSVWQQGTMATAHGPQSGPGANAKLWVLAPKDSPGAQARAKDSAKATAKGAAKPPSIGGFMEHFVPMVIDGCRQGELVEEHNGTVNGQDAAWGIWINTPASPKKPSNSARSGGILGDMVLREGPGPAKPNAASLKGIMMVVTGDGDSYVVICHVPEADFDGLKATLEGICGSFKVLPTEAGAPPARS